MNKERTAAALNHLGDPPTDRPTSSIKPIESSPASQSASGAASQPASQPARRPVNKPVSQASSQPASQAASRLEDVFCNTAYQLPFQPARTSSVLRINRRSNVA
eukprot:Selendium_serpulae@DN5267_c0_g1_i1.p1